MTLNKQQRSIFDDFCECHIAEDDAPFYLYIGGESGTGKSCLLKMKLMIEMLRHLKLNKPSAIVMASTANASNIIKGKPIESALGMLPRKWNSFVKVNKNKMKMEMFQHLFVMKSAWLVPVNSQKYTFNFEI
jgi:ABC-type polar amino acid transport system ATPase subunit